MNLTAILGAAGAAYLFFRKKDEVDWRQTPCGNPAVATSSIFQRCCQNNPTSPGCSGAIGAWPIMFPEAPGPTVLAMGSLGESPCGSAAWLREVYRGTCPHRRAAWDRLSRAGCAPSTARPRCVGQGMA